MSNCTCNNSRCKHRPMAHLHLHTEFSTLDGVSRSSSLIKLAKEYNHPAITILDHGNASGWLTHYQQCKAANIKPILGMEAYLTDNLEKTTKKEDNENKDDSEKNTHQSIIIKNQEGFVNLNRLIYRSFTEGYYYKGRITTEWLLENKKGLIVTTSCMASKFARLIKEGKFDEAEERIKLFKREFGDDFYAELQFNEIPDQKEYNNFILKMIKKHDLQPILTGDVHYAEPEDNKLQDILIAISQKKPVGEAFSLQARELYYTNFSNFHEMNKRLGFNYPEHYVDLCLDNTLKVAEKCNFEFDTSDKYPKYEITPDVQNYFKTTDTKEIIYKLANAKLKKKLSEYKINKIVEITEEKEKQYYDRLAYELQVVSDKNVLDYFMVMWELIRFCKDNDVETGPGRGSSAGSLLAFCLDITKIDPIRFDLYFERFLNPTRKNLPDVDTDFEAGSDEKTLNFLYEKYGKERVVPIITFSRFNEKGCFKDVAKALGHDTGYSSDVFAITKEMPKLFNTKKVFEGNLEDWFVQWPNNKECSLRVRNWILHPNNKEVIKYTIKLQGQLRNLGKHAAGMVITPGPVWESMPVNICKGQIVSGFQESGRVKDLSDIGILKLDRLNLETLNVIKEALEHIKEKRGEEEYNKAKFEVENVNLKDTNLFDELNLGFNQGIFQFESAGISTLAKNIKIESFDEVVNTSALYRPGPLNIKAHEEYIKNKYEPTKRQYAHPILAPLLEDTNGVLIFQEQLMFIANKIGGLSLGEGDNLRKVMDGAGKIILKKLEGKELTEEDIKNKNYIAYNDLWPKFINGAKGKGLSDEDVQKIESWLIKYLGYSFNKSHSVSYSYITMQTLYLKHYYPTEFYCALLNHTKTITDKDLEKAWFNATILAAMTKGIRIVQPNRKSNWDYTILEDKIIAMGYSSINGMGDVAYNEIKVNKIENMTKEDFFQTKWSKFNKGSFEACLKAGLFDDWAASRQELLDIKEIKHKQTNQLDLFSGEITTVFDVAERKKVTNHPPTTDEEKYISFMEVCTLDINLLNKIRSVKEQFLEANGVEIDAITNFSDPNDYYYFLLTSIEKKANSWDGSEYYLLGLSDGSTVKKVIMSYQQYEKLKLIMEKNSFFVTKFYLNKKGFLSFNSAAQFRKMLV